MPDPGRTYSPEGSALSEMLPFAWRSSGALGTIPSLNDPSNGSSTFVDKMYEALTPALSGRRLRSLVSSTRSPLTSPPHLLRRSPRTPPATPQGGGSMSISGKVPGTGSVPAPSPESDYEKQIKQAAEAAGAHRGGLGARAGEGGERSRGHQAQHGPARPALGR